MRKHFLPAYACARLFLLSACAARAQAQREGSLDVQDEVTLASAPCAIAGVKFEHNVYPGVEVMPSQRVAWAVQSDSLLWAGASHTVRAPARIDRELIVDSPTASLRF